MIDYPKHKAEVGTNIRYNRVRVKEIIKHSFKNGLHWDVVMHNYLKLEY